MTTRTKTSIAVCIAAAALVAGLAVFFARRGEPSGVDVKRGDSPSRAPRIASAAPVRKARAANGAAAAPRRAAPIGAARPKPQLNFAADDGEDDGRTPQERALAARIEKALDDESLEAAVACAGEALKCGVAEIRRSMVETLGWFGEKALPELAPFMADADEDVRTSALDEWTMALANIEDEGYKIRVVELAMGALNSEDALEDIANEYIGVDEKLAVESLARIIAGDGTKEGIAKAKETYEFVTGEEWTDAEAAARWVAEEYSPPEEEP